MNKRRSLEFKIHSGTASILLIFIILCLVSFSLLSVSSANADMKLSRKLADRSTSYYGAVAQAEKFIADTDSRLIKIYERSENEKEFMEAVLKEFGTAVINGQFEITSAQYIDLTLNVKWQKKDTAMTTAALFDISSYNVITAEDDLSYDDQPLYGKKPH